MLNGLYDAQMDNQPVVAIVGQQGLAALGTFVQQESNLERSFADVACYVQTITTPDQAQVVVDTAFRTARLRLQPAVIVLPHDVQAMEWEAPSPANWVARSSAVAPSTAVAPPLSEIQKMADVINAGTGELLRELTLDTTRSYQPTGNPRVAGETGSTRHPNVGSRSFPCPATSHGAPGRIRTRDPLLRSPFHVNH